ncbi:MAG: helix-turn-helix transcriptional regulator [Pseudomonadota bacterium]
MSDNLSNGKVKVNDNLAIRKLNRCYKTSYAQRMALELRIREIREGKGMKLAELAEICGFSEAHMSQVERGKKNLNNHLIERISNALEVSPPELFATADGHLDWQFARLSSRMTPEEREKAEAFILGMLAGSERPSGTS